ncbi:hypothetical protein AYO45_01855 [Gammaproteobacteria bacterium SCGC AG-212-F23]|nr:hypothetical protein AYO45_01855 [Gammaproteobacteria bacterium SCGC AG-212-F23]
MLIKPKTIVITGGSRGIGEAIALRYLYTKAKVVILDSKLPADQSIATHKNFLAIHVDIKDATAVEREINQVADRLGSIDILINNVSAFSFTDICHTTMEAFDLLFATNVRATFLMSKLCYPFLKDSANPHIINISPPLDIDKKWFKNHLAFTLSKYAMSMCTLAMAEEFKKDGIGVNSLWPMTTIATTTIRDHFSDEVYKKSRWPTIMADAVYKLAKRPAKTCTGQFFIDELLLREEGVTDFEQYAVDPTVALMQDLFVPEENIISGTALTLKYFI